VASRSTNDSAIRRLRHHATIVLSVTAGLALAACGSSSGGQPASSTSAGAASLAAGKTLNIAYLSFAVENSYDAPVLAAAQGVASDENANVKVFDANNSPQTQYSQLQDVINSGQYGGIIVQPIFGTGATSTLRAATPRRRA
jgi:ribose transport system substrate-binding protein